VCSLGRMVEPNLLAGSVPCATRVPFCRAPLEAGQAGVSERDELASRSFPRTALESDHEAHLERCCQPSKRLWLGRILTALHARDRRVARAHSFGELLLGEPELGAVLDDQARKRLVGREALLLRSVLRAFPGSTTGSVASGIPDRAPLKSSAHRALLISDPSLSALISGKGSRSVVSGGSGRRSPRRVHPLPEVCAINDQLAAAEASARRVRRSASGGAAAGGKAARGARGRGTSGKSRRCGCSAICSGVGATSSRSVGRGAGRHGRAMRRYAATSGSRVSARSHACAAALPQPGVHAGGR
jgi:hypothetical protein